MSALIGSLVSVPLIKVITTGIATRHYEIEKCKNASQTYQQAVGLLGSTAFVTTAFGLQYTAKDDLRLRFACAVMMTSAATGATLAAYGAQEESLERLPSSKRPLTSRNLSLSRSSRCCVPSSSRSSSSKGCSGAASRHRSSLSAGAVRTGAAPTLRLLCRV